MSPIITHEDELELAKSEKELVNKIKKLASVQKSVISSQSNLANNISKLILARDGLNKTLREVLKQMQTLAREKRSNIGDEEVELLHGIIQKNDGYIQGSKNWMEAIKDLTIHKESFISKKLEFADALTAVAGKRSGVIKKAMSMEKAQNKMMDGDKIELLDQQFNDAQREFDRARDELIKKIQQFTQSRDELDQLWIKLKDSLTELS
jgi:hypothetical protein